MLRMFEDVILNWWDGMKGRSTAFVQDDVGEVIGRLMRFTAIKKWLDRSLASLSRASRC